MHAKKTSFFLAPFLMAIADVCMVSIGFMSAYGFKFSGSLLSNFIIITLQSSATVTIFWGLGLYEKRQSDFLHIMYTFVVGIAAVLLATAVLNFGISGSFIDRAMFQGWAMQVLLLGLWRFGYWELKRRVNIQRLLIIGPIDDAEKLLERIDSYENWFCEIKVLDSRDTDQLSRWLIDIDTVLLLPTIGKEKRSQVLEACQEARCSVLLVPEFYDILLIKSRVIQLNDLAVLEIQDFGLTIFQRTAKRTMDIAISLIGLVLTAPLMLICALFIYITSSRPVIIAQPRVGRGESVYCMYKLRTMVQDAEKKTGPVLAAEKDPRITPVGRILRYTRIDELPQLFNVLKGEMSFVGPRPERPFFVERYNREFPNYRYRHYEKPGITGLAQIAGKYTTSPEDKLRFDLYYISNYSLLLDLKIILQTIPIVFWQKSSAGKKVELPVKTWYQPIINSTFMNRK